MESQYERVQNVGIVVGIIPVRLHEADFDIAIIKSWERHDMMFGEGAEQRVLCIELICDGKVGRGSSRERRVRLVRTADSRMQGRGGGVWNIGVPEARTDRDPNSIIEGSNGLLLVL